MRAVLPLILSMAALALPMVLPLALPLNAQAKEVPGDEEFFPGDLIFLGDTKGWADIGRALSVSDQRYGHVGVVTIVKSKLMVVHASGSPLPDTAGVSRTPIEVFYSSAGLVGHYRPKLTATQTDDFIAAINLAADAGIGFDSKFSLDTDDLVYCTELVWQSLSLAVGQDAVPDKTQWHGKSVISLEDLQNAPHLQVVDHFTRDRRP